MGISKKFLLLCFCCISLSSCYLDVETPKLSDIPSSHENKTANFDDLNAELKEAKQQNKIRRENLEEKEE